MQEVSGARDGVFADVVEHFLHAPLPHGLKGCECLREAPLAPLPIFFLRFDGVPAIAVYLALLASRLDLFSLSRLSLFLVLADLDILCPFVDLKEEETGLEPAQLTKPQMACLFPTSRWRPLSQLSYLPLEFILAAISLLSSALSPKNDVVFNLIFGRHTHLGGKLLSKAHMLGRGHTLEVSTFRCVIKKNLLETSRVRIGDRGANEKAIRKQILTIRHESTS